MIRDRQIFDYDGVRVECLGDPHLGKRFNAGVPLQRRGDREDMVWQDFTDNVLNTKAHVHVCMGDLFDHFIVDPTTMVKAAEIYKFAAEKNKDTNYFVLMGNHDMSRDLEKLSSFSVFKRLVANHVTVCDEARGGVLFGKYFAFFPYHPITTSHEMMEKAIGDFRHLFLGDRKFDAIFGHWDLDSFGEMPHNIFPHELAQSITDDAYTGHIHLPGVREYGNLQLNVIGSMQPYNHSEDPERKLYTTLTMDMLRHADPLTLKNKCVRIVLGPNEEAPEQLDCLQYITKNLDALEDDADIEVKLEDFDFRQIITSEMVKQGVTETEVMTYVLSEFDRLRSEEASK